MTRPDIHRTTLSLLIAALGSLGPTTLVAQHHAGHSPYAGQEGRAIKALSPDQVAALLAGEGMGFALAAELNAVPGPLHLLELADSVGLTPEQRVEVEEVRERMLERARDLGARVVEAESHLDRMFAMGHATEESVAAATLEIGRLNGELRSVHLVAHLETARLLSADQISAYGRLRGYAAP